METMTAQRMGVFRRWARQFGLTLDEYLRLCETQKRCQKCKKWKPREEFASDKSRHDGLNVRCHACIITGLPPQWHIMTTEERERLSERMKGNKFRQGIPLSDTHKRMLHDLRKAEGENGNGTFYGANNPNWKGGVTPENLIARNSAAYREWRKAVFERDHYTCRRCGDSRGGNLHPHHIKKFSDFPGLRYDVSNGETLCFDCHANEHDVPNSYRKRRYERRKARAAA